MSTFVSRLVLTSLAAALLWCAPRTAQAADYTDVWWIPAESGWGVNVIQSENLLFLTFFIYGSDNKPTWYTAQLTLDATGAYSGGLYLTSGTYYALPWNTGDAIPAQQVGSASFKPSSANAYQATLTYVVNGVGTVTKAVERQGLTTINLGGTYTGGLSAAQTGCSTSGTYRNTYDLQVSQTGSGATTFTFTFPTYSCTLSGTVALHGTQYTIDGATYQCTGGFSSTANMSEIKATAQGIEGRWVASTGGGCTENAYFSAVLY